MSIPVHVHWVNRGATRRIFCRGDAESSSEDQLRKIASYMRQRLTDSQRQWLATQSEALNTSSEQIMSDVLGEWFVRHLEAAGNGGSLGDFLPEALEEFISRHHEEFLPVVAPG